MVHNGEKGISVTLAISTLLIVAVIMSVGMGVMKLNGMITFLLALVGVCVVAICTGVRLEELQNILIKGFNNSSLTVMILVAVGMVVGSWIISGIVPSIIYYGLKIFTPSSFLLVGFLISCIVSFFTGSSYASLGTLGVAFMAIGYGMGINPGLVAGMSVSGAVFGDKMSPFSDTTNMAPGAAGTDIFLHIRSMMYTIIPSFIISAVLYYFLGTRYSVSSANSISSITAIMDALRTSFTISPLLLIVPVLTVLLVIKKMPAVIALVLGAFGGVVAGLIAQPQFSLKEIITSMAIGFKGSFKVEALEKLLNRGGISSMMSVVVYCLLALALGELMYEMGILTTLFNSVKGKLLKPSNLIISALFSCLITVMLTTSQYMGILLPGEMFREPFKQAHIAPYVLSRTLEDGGTVFAFLVPWSAAAIYSTGVLGVSTLEYLPFAFLPICCPLAAIVYAITGIGVFDTNNQSLRGKTNKLHE